MDSVVKDFPSWTLQPRSETGARAFLSKYDKYDGRGTVIAILDSGVDPGAGGLQVTSDGKVKVIERIDASGAGDVDMSKEVVVPADGEITGLTGKKLVVPRAWKASKVRIGCKRVYSLYPSRLRERIQKERVDKEWDPLHKMNLAKATKQLQEFENSKKTEESSSSAKSGDSGLSGMEKLHKDNLEAQIEMLNLVDKKLKPNNGGGSKIDTGPVFDIISFQDENNGWNVVIDNTKDGDLAAALKLRPFEETHEYGCLTEADKLNVSVNVYDEGDVVQIVAICSSHGTHVASIAAANFPDQPEKNGLAPGAQIVAITIGDGRLSSMETGTALVRAMTYIMQRQKSGKKIDVINMSYGEPSHWSNAGRVGELMHEVIDKYGVVWIASAGNDGPALSTVGTPPDISTNTVIAVGAYVSPEMMVALYSSREKLPGTPYTWTSRGPTIDGDRGVTICAPGGAITSVPTFTLTGSQLMNGTSMASPHVCGAVALMISGLKQRSVGFTPFSIKRALSVTAKHLTHLCHFAQGHGLLQVEQAFEHLVKYGDSVDMDVRFAITCNSGFKGIHLRDMNVCKAMEVPVKVEPIFLDPDNKAADAKIKFNMKFALACPSSWVNCADHLDLMYTARHFLVWVDPTGLEPGVHSTFVRAYDVAQPDKGSLFEIPITVVKPEPLVEKPRPHISYSNVAFGPGTIKRHFLPVPDHSTWATVRIMSNETMASGKFLLHTIQLVPRKAYKTLETRKMFTLSEHGEAVHSFAVKSGFLLEVCIAKQWSNIGNVDMSYSVTFHGLEPDQKEIAIHGADGVVRLDITSALHEEDVQPEAKLKLVVQNYRPLEAKIVALGERDIIPPHRTIYELQLSYNLTVSKATEITPYFPLLSDVLYESEFEAQLWMLYNSHKQLVQCGDAGPSKYTVKVEKDDYTLRAHVRHEKRELLDKLMDLPLKVNVKLTTPLTLDVYGSFAQASIGGKKINSFSKPAKAIIPIYLAAPSSSSDKHCKNAMLGQYLSGTLTLAKDELGKKVDVYKIKYFLNDPSKRDKNGGRGGSGSSKSGSSKSDTSSSNNSSNGFQESLVDYKIGWLAKLDPFSDEGKVVYKDLTTGNQTGSQQVHVRSARLASLEVDKKISLEGVTVEKAEEALALCDYILREGIQEDAILAFLATKHDARPDANEIKKDMEKQKGWYLDALCKKGLALCYLKRPEEATELLFKALKIVGEPTADAKVAFFAAVHAQHVQHYARALKLVLHQLENKPNSTDLDGQATKLYQLLEWQHCAQLARETFPARFPADYEMF